MLTLENIENPKDIYVLKQLWDYPCGVIEGGMKIIKNRWYVPITFVAEKCSMTVEQLLEEHTFAEDIEAFSIGSFAFTKAIAEKNNKKYNALVSSCLIFANGNPVYIDRV